MARSRVVGLVLVLFSVLSLAAQQGASQQELKQAAIEAPLLAEVLELKPGLVVGDVGAGFGAMTIFLSQWLGPSGHVYATDITPHALAALRAEVSERRLSNVTVIEGGAASTNLPDACCDALLLAHVYHHLTQPEYFTRSVAAALKPGGRFAVTDFAPTDTEVPAGVPANREGHGIRSELLINEVTSAGLIHVKTIPDWRPYRSSGTRYLVLFRKP